MSADTNHILHNDKTKNLRWNLSAQLAVGRPTITIKDGVDYSSITLCAWLMRKWFSLSCGWQWPPECVKPISNYNWLILSIVKRMMRRQTIPESRPKIHTKYLHNCMSVSSHCNLIVSILCENAARSNDRSTSTHTRKKFLLTERTAVHLSRSHLTRWCTRWSG